MRIGLALLGAFTFFASNSAFADAVSGRFGGYEDTLCYGDTAGNSAPAAADVYEALVQCQQPHENKSVSGASGSARDDGPTMMDGSARGGEPPDATMCKIIRVGAPACKAPLADVPTSIWLHVGPGSVSYSLTEQRATSIGGGRPGAEAGTMQTCAQRNQMQSGEFKLSAPLPAGWRALVRDNYRTFCTIEQGGSDCNFTFNLGEGDTLIGEIDDPRPNKGGSIAAVGIKATDDGVCHD